MGGFIDLQKNLRIHETTGILICYLSCIMVLPYPSGEAFDVTRKLKRISFAGEFIENQTVDK